MCEDLLGPSAANHLEGCTGWRYVVEEITAAGFEAHLAEPADTQAAQGLKPYAETDPAGNGAIRSAKARAQLAGDAVKLRQPSADRRRLPDDRHHRRRGVADCG